MQIGANFCSHLTLTLDLLNQKSVGFDRVSRTTVQYNAKFQVIATRGFRFILHPHTHLYTHIMTHDKVVTISATPYVFGADNYTDSIDVMVESRKVDCHEFVSHCLRPT